MSLFKSINKNERSINEDLKTFAHNIWTRTVSVDYSNSPKYGKTGGASILDVPLLIGFCKGLFYLSGLPLVLATFYRLTMMTDVSLTDYLDRSYFDSMYKITPKVENKLLKMIKSIKGKVKPVQVLGLAASDNKEEILRLVKDELAKISVRIQAKKDIRSDPGLFGKATSKALTYYNLKVGNSFYIILFEFDSNLISNAYVVCQDNRKILHNIRIPINEIDPNEYKY